MLSLVLPDKSGELADIPLGYDTIDKYKNDSTYFRAIVGRVANRIGGAQFTLDGTRYKIVANEGNNTLHGGPIGFSDVIWTMKSYREESHVTFGYESYDGEQGFPGDLSVSGTYMIIETNKLGVKTEAKALNKATPVNLALHTYWNLGSHSNGDILSQTIQLFASKITQVDEHLIPTGGIINIEELPYGFLQPRQIGSRINELPHGYDINYILDNTGHRHLKKVAVVEDSITGRKMELWSNQPGVQFYTANYLENKRGKGGFVYSSHAGLCLETQGFPDSVNHRNFLHRLLVPDRLMNM
ncbi:galactose mutarotase [Rhodamnia argentea]|uniref:Galactose mutarotase n=1 Tax=Rhodamnia argentea TaxID=178133 RepID=A0A8B8NGR7_9MYRT|nr:galactose mutarotase [Rhodamnia argentea]